MRMRAAFLRIFGLLLSLSLVVLFAIPAQAASQAGVGVITTGPIQSGSTIIVGGSVASDNNLPPEVASGQATVTLSSKAFLGGTGSTSGSVVFPVGGTVSMAPGTFRGQVAIRSDAPSGDYTLTAVFEGSVIGTAHFTVHAAAVTPQPAGQATVVVTPATVHAGSTIVIQGNVLVPPDNHLPPELANGNGSIALFSDGIPRGWAYVDVWGPGGSGPLGTFRTEIAVPSDLPSGDYVVMGFFASTGRNIGTAHFTVTGAGVKPQPTVPATTHPNLPDTGQTVQLPSWWPAALAGVLVLLLAPWVGIALLWRRRL